MEIICKCIQQHPLRVRDYEDRNTHENKQFKSVGLVLYAGTDNIFCEAVQEYAEYLTNNPLSSNHLYAAQLTLTARSFKDAQGNERWQTEARLTRIIPLL